MNQLRILNLSIRGIRGLCGKGALVRSLGSKEHMKAMKTSNLVLESVQGFQCPRTNYLTYPNILVLF